MTLSSKQPLAFDPQQLALWIEQAVAEARAVSVFSAKSPVVDSLEVEVDLVTLNDLRDALNQGEEALNDTQRGLAETLWAHFSTQDRYVRSPARIAAPEARIAGPFWTPIDPKEYVGLFPLEDSPNVATDSVAAPPLESSDLDKAHETSLEYTGPSYAKKIKSWMRTALRRLSSDSHLAWPAHKARELRDLSKKLTPWQDTPRYRHLAILALQRAYLEWPGVHQGHQATAQSMINWLQSLDNAQTTPLDPELLITFPDDSMIYLSEESVAGPTSKVPLALKLDPEASAVSSQVLSEEEFSQRQEIMDDLRMIAESDLHIQPQARELLALLQRWSSQHAGNYSSMSRPRAWDRAIALIYNWKATTLLVNTKTVIERSSINYDILVRSGRHLQGSYRASPEMINSSLRHLGGGLLREHLNFYLRQLEVLGETSANPQQWKKWVLRYPDFTAITLVLSGQGRHPHAQAILRMLSPEIPPWTLYVLSKIQRSKYGNQVWRIRDIKSQGSSLDPSSVDSRQVEAKVRKAKQLLRNQELQVAFEAAGVSTYEAREMTLQAMEAVGYSPQPADFEANTLPFEVLNPAEQTMITEHLTILSLLGSRDTILARAGVSVKQWTSLIRAWRERRNPEFWTVEHNLQIAKVLRAVLKNPVEGLSVDLYASIASKLENSQTVASSQGANRSHQQAERMNEILLTVLQESIVHIRATKVTDIALSWQDYKNLKGDTIPSVIRQRKAQAFTTALEALLINRANGLRGPLFLDWLENQCKGPNGHNFLTDLSKLAGESLLGDYRGLMTAIHLSRILHRQQQRRERQSSGVALAEGPPNGRGMGVSDEREGRQERHRTKRGDVRRVRVLEEESKDPAIERAKARARAAIESRRPGLRGIK